MVAGYESAFSVGHDLTDHWGPVGITLDSSMVFDNSYSMAPLPSPLEGKHNGQPLPHMCPVKGCQKYYKDRISMKRHMKTHQPAQHQCLYCSAAFSRSDILRNHERIKHPEVLKECASCKFTFNPAKAHICPRNQYSAPSTGDSRAPSAT